MVYIKEAHPDTDDEASLIHNVRAGIHVEEATTDTERAIAARTMSDILTQPPASWRHFGAGDRIAQE